MCAACAVFVKLSSATTVFPKTSGVVVPVECELVHCDIAIILFVSFFKLKFVELTLGS